MNAESTISADSEIGIVSPPRRRGLRTVLMIVGPALVLAGTAWFYFTSGRYESTDSASLQTAMVAISPSVAGTVVAVEVRENQRVRKGDVLFRVKADTFQTSLAQAEAELATARTDVESMQADYREALSQVSAARARYDLATSEAARQKSLVAEGISSRAQYDQAVTQARTARDAIAAAQAKADSLRAGLSGAIGGSVDSHPDVRQAISKLGQARANLSDTVVRAPRDGIVTKVNQLQVGNYVTPGRPVFTLAGLNFWVQANFKESQLRYMRVNQPVEITIDAYPDQVLKGHVESFSPGTGSSFSILPPENATGNWVKVVQRLPVQVAIDDVPADLPLSAGLSTSVKVDTGHRRRLFAPDAAPDAPQPAPSRTLPPRP
ncbi:membrane fusion protein, multidrug efflux system [Novosphingobium sp. CF614]|uniref:HlyD family secretion protein n=1 Tax=Novosphingobium sp. CF614 TaxID=1884364 RepID=UPI0008E70451|nr:HlyD family secretion protein [Novosphingobium sp. CF614]SFG27925.1 membrane fusion protein, multidrug efflux system [Novosphingobium sp. CF614]